MSTRNAPPVAAIVVGVLIAAVVGVVVMKRAANGPRDDHPGGPKAAARAEPSALDQGRAFEAAGQLEEAAAVLRRDLDKNPHHLGALQVLRRVLPHDQKSELAARLAKTDMAGDFIDTLYDDARDDGDAGSLTVLHGWLKANRPADHRWACEEIENKIGAEQYPQATKQFRDRLAAATTYDGRNQILLTYLHGMRAAGKLLDAYAAVPDAHTALALRTLAGPHENALLETTAPAPAADGQKTSLRALIAAHRNRSPLDAQLWYYEGVLLQSGGEYERAEKVYADGQSKLVPPAVPPEVGQPPQPGEWAWDNERFRARRVECLYHLGRAMKAYAEVPPAEETFRQLAHALLADKKAAGLTELVAAHKTKFPTDAQVTYWEAEVLFLSGEYAAAAAAFEAFDKSPVLPGLEWRRATDRLVRCHLRVGNAAAAQAVVARDAVGRVSVALRAAVLAALGEAESLDSILGEQLGRAGSIFTFYADEDFSRAFAPARFPALRMKYPDPRAK